MSSKNTLRTEAKRARALMSLNADQHKRIIEIFFEHVPMTDDAIVAFYWSKGRELDTQPLIDACLDRGITIALPVIEKDTRILKFAHFDAATELVSGQFDVVHPVVNDQTEWLDPNVFVVPMLAFDRRGYRLGYGGGYYDATLTHHAVGSKISCIGLAYAAQACLFNLPAEEHDVPMDMIITEQGIHKY